MAHQIKIFQGFSEAGIDRLEETVNRWLADNASNIQEVHGVQTSMIRMDPDAERDADRGAEDGARRQSYVVTIWYSRHG